LLLFFKASLLPCALVHAVPAVAVVTPVLVCALMPYFCYYKRHVAFTAIGTMFPVVVSYCKVLPDHDTPRGEGDIRVAAAPLTTNFSFPP